MRLPLLAIVTLCVFQSCHVGRSFTRFTANITDHKIFPYTPIQTGKEKFSFSKGPDQAHQDLMVKTKSGEQLDLNTYLQDERKTTAFLVIHKDQIVYEKYYQGYNPEDISNIFSASKSITSLLAGIAVDERKIESVHDPVTKYIPELKDAAPEFQKLTIEHLLNMRTGLKFKEAYLNPFAHVAKLYYGQNQLKQISQLKFGHKPGSTHKYTSVPTAILGTVIERATNMELGKYLEQKVWIPMGMEYPASWSVDDKKNRSTKAYCCLNTTARDLAKIGRLYLNNGNWNGKQIVSQAWIEASTQPNTANECYQYQWYTKSAIVFRNKGLETFTDSVSAINAAQKKGYEYYYVKNNGKSDQWTIHQCAENFFAIGILGQFLYVDPKNEIIIVRLGKQFGSNYFNLFEQIITQLK